MRVRRIMCPVDFSSSSTAALDEAASLAFQLDAQLLIVHVDSRPLPCGAAPSVNCHGEPKRTRLERLAPSVKGVKYEHFLIDGRPAEEIPNFARSHNVDLVVMGRHYQSRRFHNRHDGICDSAAKRCQCPVLTINHEEVEAAWLH
jgi:nucleotide-binding universal stress UspA family protein